MWNEKHVHSRHFREFPDFVKFDHQLQDETLQFPKDDNAWNFQVIQVLYQDVTKIKWKEKENEVCFVLVWKFKINK